MQDEEKNEAARGRLNRRPPRMALRRERRAAAQSEHEVVHHPLLFRI